MLRFRPSARTTWYTFEADWPHQDGTSDHRMSRGGGVICKLVPRAADHLCQAARVRPTSPVFARHQLRARLILTPFSAMPSVVIETEWVEPATATAMEAVRPPPTIDRLTLEADALPLTRPPAL